MKFKLLTLITIITMLMVGCTNANNNAADNGNDSLDELNPNVNNENRPGNQPSETQEDYKLGYVRYKKDQLDMDTENERTININRNKMADIITRTILKTDGFNEAATLVTNDEVLIAYDKADEDERDIHEAANIARQTALSVMPRFYDVYVSDNESLMDDIHSLHNSNVNDNDHNNTIQNIIKEMKKSPQGTKRD